MRNEEVEYFESLSETEKFEVRGKQFKGDRTIVSISPVDSDFFPENFEMFISYLMKKREEQVKLLSGCLNTSRFHY